MPFEGIQKSLRALWEKKAKASFAAQLTRIVKDEVTRGNRPSDPAAIKAAGDALKLLDKHVAKASKSGDADDLDAVETQAGKAETALVAVIEGADGAFRDELRALLREIDTRDGIGATARDVQKATGMAAQYREENRAKVRALVVRQQTLSKAVDAAISRLAALKKDALAAETARQVEDTVRRYGKMEKEFRDLQTQYNTAVADLRDIDL